MIEVQIFGGLAEVSTDGRGRREVPYPVGGTTVGRILADLGIPEAAVGIVMVNGRPGGLGTQVHDGDRVAFFAPAGGG